MEAGVQELVEIGHDEYCVMESEMQFFTETITVPIEAPTDEWEFRVSNLKKALSFNSSTSTPMPWEAWLFEPSQLPGYRMTLKVGLIFIKFLSFLKTNKALR